MINWCGGAEWVAINIMTVLKASGHQVIVLTDKPLNQDKFKNVFDKKISVDQQVVFPFRFFPPTDYHNIYTDAIRSLMLKSKCEILIDTHSNAILPGMDVSYIQILFLKQLSLKLRNRLYYYPYRRFLDSYKKDVNDKLVFANSKFTADVVRAEIGINPLVLYPPISSDFSNCIEAYSNRQKENIVVTVARISHEKNLNIIPYIANLTSKEVSFIIAGLLYSREVLNSLCNSINKLKVSEKVKIFTNVNRHRLKKILSSSKVYLHTAINEPFGISIVEAMASGCIPIVHDSGGPREFVPKGLRYNSMEEAAEKVEKAIDNWSPERASRMSKMADRFSDKNFCKQFMDFFNKHFGTTT